MHLFKFLDNKCGNIEKLCDGLIYLTPPKHLNDFMEFRYSPGIPSNVATMAMLNKFNHEEYQALPRDSRKITSFEKFLTLRAGLNGDFVRFLNSPDFITSAEDRISEEMSKVVGVTSFTENAAKHSMWTRYADDFRGVTIELVTGNIFSFHAIPACPLALGASALKVSYTTTTTVAPHTAAGIAKILTTKDKDSWHDEREWRIIHPLALADIVTSINGQNHYFWELSLGTVRGVIYGENIDHGLRQRIAAWFSRAHPRAYARIAMNQDGKVRFNRCGS